MKPEDLVGSQIGRYQLEALVGAGGVAAVYRAVDTASGGRLAIKVLFPPPGAGPALGERFRREARTAARLEHPGILRVLDVGEAGGRLFIVMPLVEGPSLQALLERRGRFDEATAAELAAQVADALDYAHRQGVIHRDVKPSNILIDPEGGALLTDFGVARALDDPSLTATGFTVGTPATMSPEQASGHAGLDGRADLYSLGVVLYQMVTGRTPFKGSTPQVMHAHVYEPAPPPSSLADVSPAMEAIILRTLSKNPDDRYPSGAALAAELWALAEATRTRQPVVSTPHPRRARLAGTRPARVLAVLLAVALVGGGIWLVAGSPSLGPPPSLTHGAPVAAVPPATPSPSPARPAPTATYQALRPSPSRNSVTPSSMPTASPSSTPPPSPLPPTPTSTPYPTPTVCPRPAAAVFAAWLASDAELAARVGCPRGQEALAPAAWEPFESGQMLWRGDLYQVYTLLQAGTWALYDDRWREGDLEWDASIVPPAGLHQPVRGFGLAWREQPGVRDALGWATATEVSFDAAFQPFERALLVADGEVGRLWALLGDGTWLAGP